MRRLVVIPTLAALLLVGAGCSSATSSPAVDQPAQPAAIPEGATVVSMTDNGFSPTEVSVSAGTTVYFKTTGARAHWVASAVHPVHSDLPGFDALRTIQTGQFYAFTFAKVGNWTFHDHLNPGNTGVVHVTE